MLAIAVASVFYYTTFMRAADRISYRGLFPPFLTGAIGILLALGLLEVYFSFFTPENSDTPFWFGASQRSRYLLLITAGNAILLFLHGAAQHRGFFLRPHQPCTDETEERVDAESDRDFVETPLAQARGNNGTPSLVDTPEYSGSWFDTFTFSWVSDIFDSGSRRQLDYVDLYRLDTSDMTIPNWCRYAKHRKPGRSLLTTLMLAFAPQLLAQLLLSVVIAVLHYSGPFFLQRILQSVEIIGNGAAGGTPAKSIRSAYLDAFGLLFFTVMNSLIATRVVWIGSHLDFRMKGLLVAELSTKTLNRSAKESPADTTDKDDGDDKYGSGDGSESAQEATNGKIMNLLTTDLNRVARVTGSLDDLCVLPMMAIIGLFYLFQLLGWSSLIGFSIVIPYYLLTRKIFNCLSELDEKTWELSDRRVEAITELLQGIKAVKLYGWESRFLEIIDRHREDQLDSMWRWLLGLTHAYFVTNLAPLLTLVLVLLTYVGVFGNTLNSEVAFTAISVFQLLHVAVEHFPEYLSWTISGYVSLRRIESYLAMPQAQDLKDRVNRVDDDGDALGFTKANLVWDTYAKDDLDDTANDATHMANANEDTPLISNTLTHSNASLDSHQNQLDKTAFMLKDIDVHFAAGGLSIIAGPTGSGKSSLLSAFIGEMTLISGFIQMPTVNAVQTIASNRDYQDVIELSREQETTRDIAYVAQEAWLRNATIRENILFGEPYDQQRYEEVLRVCALKPDLRILTAGDQTEIGERGVTLSGGQKQRVALARAVYSDRRILLIDDCLSAVDAHTAKHILMECLLNKTPLMHGRTRVLVTHHVSMCLPYAQYIAVMREGEIALKGNPQELQAMGKFSATLAELETKDDTKAEEGSKGKEVEDIEDEGSAERAKAVNDPTSEDEYNIERLRKLAVAKGLDPTADLSAFEGTLIEDEEREAGYVKAEVWRAFFAACGSHWYWVIMVLLSVLINVLLVTRDYWIRIWVRSMEFSPLVTAIPSSSNSTSPAADTNTVGQHAVSFWIGIYLVIGIIHVVVLAAQVAFAYSGTIKGARDMHSKLLRSVVCATPRFFDSTPFGRIINRFSHDIESFGVATMDSILWVLGDLTAAIGVILVIASVTPPFILAAVGIIAAYVLIAKRFLESTRELKRLESIATAPLLSLYGELIQGVPSIRAFGIKKYYIMEAINRLDAQNIPFYLTTVAIRWLIVRLEFVGACVSFFSAFFILWNAHTLDVGLAGFALVYALTFSDHMMYVIRKYGENELNMNAVERITQYMKVEQEASAQSTPENKPASNWPRTGDLEIEDLVIEYVPNVPVLHGLNMSIKHGEKIGVVGRTGAG
ncbi:Transporter of the ATP-binding cassette (ABC), partial [Linderina pennispora]